MIIKLINRSSKDSFSRLVKYITNKEKLEQTAGKLGGLASSNADTHHGDEKPKYDGIRFHNLEGCDNLSQAVFYVEEVQKQNQRTQKDKNMHFVFALREGTKFTNQQLRDAEKELLTSLGMQNCQAISALHVDQPHPHVHVGINKIDPQTFKVHDPKASKILLSLGGERLELKYGWGSEQHHFCQSYRLTRWLRQHAKNDLLRAKHKSWKDFHRIAYRYGLDVSKSKAGLILTTQGQKTIGVKADDVAPHLSLTHMEEALETYRPVAKRDLFDEQNKFHYQDPITSSEHLSVSLKSGLEKDLLRIPIRSWEQLYQITDKHHVRIEQTERGLHFVDPITQYSCRFSDVNRNLTLANLEKHLGPYHSIQPISQNPDKMTAKDELTSQVRDAESKSAQKSVVRQLREHVVPDLKKATNWQEMHKVAGSHGVTIKLRGNGLVLTVHESKKPIYVKGSALTSDRSFSKSNLEAKLGPFEKSQNTEQSIKWPYKKESLREEEKSFWTAYQKERSDLKEHRDKAFSSLSRWTQEKYGELDKRAKKLKRRGLASFLTGSRKKTLWKNLKRDREELKVTVKQKKQGIYRRYPYQDFNRYLQHKVEEGSSQALHCLRKREMREANREKYAADLSRMIIRSGSFKEGQDIVAKNCRKTVNKHGDITYRTRDNGIVTDKRGSLSVDKMSTAASVLALTLARDKYGSVLSISGTTGAKKDAAQLAALPGSSIRFDTKDMENLRKDYSKQYSPSKVYADTDKKLYVPFSQREEAKKLGAKWDKEDKTWYVPRKMDLRPFLSWHKPGEVWKHEQQQTQHQSQGRKRKGFSQ